MTIHYTLNLCSDIDRLHLPCRNGARGLLQIKQTVEDEHVLADYIKDSQEQPLIQLKNEIY